MTPFLPRVGRLVAKLEALDLAYRLELASIR
jgi:hypothetical protein